jgi:hypothetical protein
MAADVATLLDWVNQHVPPRLASPYHRRSSLSSGRLCRDRWAPLHHAHRLLRETPRQKASNTYETVEWSPPEGTGSPMPFTRNTDCNRSVFPDRHDQARAVRGDGVRCATETILSSAPAFESGGRWSSVGRPARERHLCRRGAF